MSDKSFPRRAYTVLAKVSLGYSVLLGRFPRVTHPSATPVLLQAFDLHVLGMPPAFVLSQDQTLKLTCRTGVTPFEAKSRSQAHAIIVFDSNDMNLDALASACCDCRTPP